MQYQLEFVPISFDPKNNTELEKDPQCREYLQMSLDHFQKVGYEPPWIGYYVKFDNRFVGSAAFKGKPVNNRVEVAYGTFKNEQGKGIGTAICGHLVSIAMQTDPLVTVTARTLPEPNASGSILKKNSFVLLGTIWDEEDGNVWEWEYRPK